MEYRIVYDGILEGNRTVIEREVNLLLAGGADAQQILNETMIPAMDEVGRRFTCGDAFVPEMLAAAKTMQVGLALLKPYLVAKDMKPIGSVVVGTVKGDLHDLGKNLVAMMLEGAGFNIRDLGVDVAPAKFVEAVREGADVLAMSALLTTTMPALAASVEALMQAGLRDKVKVIVGGAPVTEAYAAQIGADGYAPDAGQAVHVVRSFLQS